MDSHIAYQFTKDGLRVGVYGIFRDISEKNEPELYNKLIKEQIENNKNNELS